MLQQERSQGMSFNLKPVIIGDVNLDGSMDIDDVTRLINALLTGDYNGILNGDVDGDGVIGISDPTDLISRLLEGVQETRLSLAELSNAMNTLYKKLHTAGWSTGGNTHHAFGLQAYTLTAEVMGDDMIMGAMGSGWFWFDASYSDKSRYTSPAWRSYDLWTAYYTCIAEANSIIAQKNNISGNTNLTNYYVGQAYAIRAYSYFMLAQWFSRTYVGHQSEPCVPIYDGEQFSYRTGTGKPRATVAQVYEQIDADISNALTLLNGKPQQVPDHISYAVALGLKARIALVKEDWATAYEAANQAKTASGKTIQEVSAFAGLNNANADNVMWGAVIPDDESGQYSSFFAHMDAFGGTYSYYAQRAPKQISKWLYNKMSTTDARRTWWDPNSEYSTGGYVTQKFRMRDGTLAAGDYIYMRVEEMYLIAAEAACRQNQTTRAKSNLTSLMRKRDPSYTCTKTGIALGSLTTDETGSLLEEILIQRRLELWGEDGRIMTIRRLRQGFNRPGEYGWPAGLQLPGKALHNPESYAWVMTIPDAEFRGNPNLNPDFMPLGDQNPLGDVTGAGQNISFESASSSKTTAQTSFVYRIIINRQSTEGEYITSVKLNSGIDPALSLSGSVIFPDGEDYAYVDIDCDNLSLGRTYRGTVSLISYDEACHSGGSHISSHTFTINCQNGNPAGQKISFEKPSLVLSTPYASMSTPIYLTRATTEGEYSATLTISDNPSNVYLGSTYVYFAEGANKAFVWLEFNNLEFGQTYDCVLSLSPQDVASGGDITSMQVSVICENWISLGWGNYESGLFGQSIEVQFSQVEGSNKYRMNQLYDYDHNIEFIIDNNNKVYIQPQPCYYASDLGIITMMGYANEDDSGYAGTYNPNTRTATLQIRYYCDAGTWPVQQESFTLP